MSKSDDVIKLLSALDLLFILSENGSSEARDKFDITWISIVQKIKQFGGEFPQDTINLAGGQEIQVSSHIQ